MADAIRIDPNTGKCVHGCFPEDCATCLGERVDLRGPLSRDSLLARLSDVLRRSGVEDAESLIVEVERRMLPDGPAHIATVTRRLSNPTSPNETIEVTFPKAANRPDGNPLFVAVVRLEETEGRHGYVTPPGPPDPPRPPNFHEAG